MKLNSILLLSNYQFINFSFWRYSWRIDPKSYWYYWDYHRFFRFRYPLVFTCWLSFDHYRSNWSCFTFWPSPIWFFQNSANWFFGVESLDWNLVVNFVIDCGSLSRIHIGEIFYEIYQGYFCFPDCFALYSHCFWKIGGGIQGSPFAGII